jgi:hypothetical protein
MERAGEAEDAAAEHDDARPSGLTPSVQAAADVDWEAVREAYELSDESVSAIEKRFGLTKHQLTRARLTGRWTTRPPVAKRKPILPRRRAVGTDIIAYRLNKLLVVGMALLETRLAEDGIVLGVLDARPKSLPALDGRRDSCEPFFAAALRHLFTLRTQREKVRAHSANSGSGAFGWDQSRVASIARPTASASSAAVSSIHSPFRRFRAKAFLIHISTFAACPHASFTE